jgi:hypothetical protein
MFWIEIVFFLKITFIIKELSKMIEQFQPVPELPFFARKYAYQYWYEILPETLPSPIPVRGKPARIIKVEL